MCKQYLVLASAVLVLYLAECAPPPNLKICVPNDAKCIKDATNTLIPVFTKGMSEYGVETLDPLYVKSINASQGNLLFTLTGVTVNGLRNCVAKKVHRDVSKSKIFLKLLCTATLDGEYNLQGSVLIVPVKGQGKIHVELNSALFDLDIDIIDKDGDDGKKHWSIKTFQHVFDLKEKSVVVFENLNKENDLLRQASEDLLRESGNEVVKEIGFPVIKLVINRVMKNVNHFFKTIPIEELSLN